MSNNASQAVAAPAERILRFPEVEHRTGLKRTAIYEGMAAGTFPRNTRIHGTRSVGWRESAINEFIARSVRATA